MNTHVDSLRKIMRKKQLDAIIIPSEDFHQSEYVGDYFKSRAFITGFTGSAGTALVTQEDALLWTDGRYFLQAETQLKETPFSLMKIDEPGVPTLYEYLDNTLEIGATLAFDGRTMSVSDGEKYAKLMEEKQGRLVYDYDFAQELWEDRPNFSKDPAFDLPVEYSGESREDKLNQIRKKMQDVSATHHISCALDDNCWMLNIRGDDIRYSPLVLNYAIVTMDTVELYIDISKIPDKLQKELESVGVRFHEYNAIYNDVKELKNATVLMDPSKMNYALFKNIPDTIERIEQPNPAILMKAIKNKTELKNIHDAHVKDGVAVTRFMKWLKENVGKKDITEMSASEKLVSYREEQGGYISPSFAPICGYKEHAAIVHYESTPDTDISLEEKGLFLTDTGANFIEGSTDITRTIALGEITDEERFHYTTVLRSHICLAMAKFLLGTSGYCLDMLARKPIWDIGMNFNHGTGHGIGYLLNIHEGPSGIRYKINPLRNEHHPIQPGMVITNEPGLYISGKHGIRIENVMICEVAEKTEYGTFLKFRPVTYAPIDKDAIDVTLLKQEEREYLNAYHAHVFEILAPHLNEDEVAWLKHYTEEI